MRTEIFTEAWRLYKMYNMTFAQALSFAWTKYKSDKVADAMNLAEANGKYKEANEAQAKLIPLVQKINALSVNLVLRVAYVSDGAKHDYMTGRYMAD